jgi:hypothetical protein
MKHLKHVSKTLAKTHKKLENHCKHTQCPDKTLGTYVTSINTLATIRPKTQMKH